jgi:transcription-repair coupling factor (superfamily II helicase)
MRTLDIFDIGGALSALHDTRLLRISGLAGSSLVLYVAALAQKRPQVLFLTTPNNIDSFYDEMKRIVAETVRISEEHPLYHDAPIVVTSDEFLNRALRQRVEYTITSGDTVNRDELARRLDFTGYSREDIVEDAEEYGVRGGILDICEPEHEPIRIEFDGDTVVSIRMFDVQTQRSVKTLPRITITLSRTDDPEPLSALIRDEAIVVSDHEVNVALPRIVCSDEGTIQYGLTPAVSYYGDLKRLRQDVERATHRYVFLLSSADMAEKLQAVLGPVETHALNLERGFIDEAHKSIYLTETELFGRIRKKKRIFRGLFIDDLMGLQEGDYVVHADYGIGQFKGLAHVDVENRTVECLQIDYAGTDKVYLPVERVNLLERYSATTEKPPKLSKLGSEVWLRTKARVRKATERLAINLLNLYTRRSQEKGFQFSPDTSELRELEASFPYEETPDQMNAIKAVKHDMEAAQPAERLICGDVGYGKTEIALRAAFKAALDGKQTMILCPTTLLAFQHHNTFRQRLERFPVRVEMVSRFRKKDELSIVLKDIASGRIDIVIGTHRLLQPDVFFKNLGLLIIDEEQRFGVVQKERIRNITPGVDTFYLSATPIPRTLYMGLTGLKDVSNIYTPPPGRKDIITKILYYDEEEMRRIITAEIERGGQVFFVHNRIQTLNTRLSTLLPDDRICMLHGQMREDITARRMVDFLEGKYDLLLSTAIVESGLDMPRVNTIIVDHAYQFGLADLHQLRGRVGRTDVQAYAFFIVPSHKRMTDEAHRRLSALVAYASLGSGFRLALRDMEIRGVGNLLGREQSGHVNAIGYNLYIKVFREAVSALQGTKVFHEPLLDVRIDAYIPSTYIEKTYERTALYKRLLTVESQHELRSIKEEITDRFGAYPQEVTYLFVLSEIRLKARAIDATEVVRRGQRIFFYREGTVVHSEMVRMCP